MVVLSFVGLFQALVGLGSSVGVAWLVGNMIHQPRGARSFPNSGGERFYAPWVAPWLLWIDVIYNEADKVGVPIWIDRKVHFLAHTQLLGKSYYDINGVRHFKLTTSTGRRGGGIGKYLGLRWSGRSPPNPGTPGAESRN